MVVNENAIFHMQLHVQLNCGLIYVFKLPVIWKHFFFFQVFKPSFFVIVPPEWTLSAPRGQTDSQWSLKYALYPEKLRKFQVRLLKNMLANYVSLVQKKLFLLKLKEK